MPRRRARLTPRKKAAVKKLQRATPDGLSESQFAALPHDYGSFVVEDSEHEQHSFSVDDVAYLLHEGSKYSGDAAKDNHWIGQIKGIRGNNPDDVWIRVQWYWAPQEVAEVIKSFDPTVCGEFEKLSSNNYDYISVYCVVGRVEVKTFDETSIHQDPIGDEEWYTRYFFHYDGRRITPKATHHACPICKIPYTPGVEKVLHFCPRPRCCNFYHQACLVKNDYLEETRSRRRLETWPTIDRTAPVDDIVSSRHPKKKQKRDHPASAKENVRDPLADFPADLVAVADQPILRGYRGGGVTGNIQSVVTARHIIFTALTQGEDVPDDWETRIDTSPVVLGTVVPNCICPSCFSAI